MPAVRRSASKKKTDSPMPSIETPVSPSSAPSRPPKPARSRTTKPTVPRTRSARKKPSFRNCVGCKESVRDYLFLGWFATVGNDFKEKCLSCRRYDAINDCLKSHADRDGNLPLKTQIHHINEQEVQMQHWAVRMEKFADVHEDDLLAAMKRVMDHPALQDAHAEFREQGNMLDDANQSDESLPDRGTMPASFGPPQYLDATDEQRGRPTALQMPRHPASSYLTPTAISPVAKSLRSAADALDSAHDSLQQPSRHPPHLATINGMFRRPYEPQTIQEWANLVVQSANLSQEQDAFFRRLDERELEAVEALMRMSCDTRSEHEP